MCPDGSFVIWVSSQFTSVYFFFLVREEDDGLADLLGVTGACLLGSLWCWPISLRDARSRHPCGHPFKATARETGLDPALCVPVCRHKSRALPDLAEADSYT